MHEPMTPPVDETDAARQKVIRGLIWREWLLHRGTLYIFMAIWLIGLWVLPIFSHPNWITVFGCLFAVAVASSMGGGDAAEGSEEFAFALPVSRGEHYRLRLAFGLSWLAFFVFAGLLAIAFNLPQLLWGLVVESGFTESNPRVKNPRTSYGLAVLVPFALFSTVFAASALARSVKGINGAQIGGVVLTYVAAGVVAWIEARMGRPVSTDVLCSALAIQALLSLGGGYLLYQRKEGVGRPVATQGGSIPFFWVVAIALAIFLALAFFLSFGTVRVNP